jgi:hypothetical protein
LEEDCGDAEASDEWRKPVGCRYFGEVGERRKGFV